MWARKSYSYPNPYKLVNMGFKTPCWIWQYGCNAQGYGVMALSRKKQVIVHRYYYIKEKGQVPAGLELDHLCGITSCVNPDHLEPVTRSENMKRFFQRLNKK